MIKKRGNPWHDSRGRFCHGPGENDSAGNPITEKQRNEAVIMSIDGNAKDISHMDTTEREHLTEHIQKEKQIQKEWENMCDSQKEQMFAKGEFYTADCLVAQKLITPEQAEYLVRNGELKSYTNKLFDIVKESGSCKSEKQAAENVSGNELRMKADYQFNGDEERAKLETIKEITGYSDEEAENARESLDSWFSYRREVDDEMTASLDRYIDDDHTYKGAIYRGLSFSEASESEMEMYETVKNRVSVIGGWKVS